MGNLGGGVPFPLATASAWPSLTGWLTLTVALTWIAAGLLLLFFGWLGLPRRLDEPPEAEPVTKSSTAGRVFGGVVLAVGAVVAGTYLLGHGSELDGLVYLGLGAIGILVYEGVTHLSASSVGHVLSRFANLLGLGIDWLGRTVVRGAWVLGSWIGYASARLQRDFPALHHLAAVGSATLWNEHGYALANLTALVLTAIVGGFAGWMSSSSKWRTSGVMTFLGLDFLALGLLGFSLLVVENAPGPVGQGLGLWLLGVEMLGMFLFLAYQFYTLEFLTGTERAPGATRFPVDPKWTPTALVQVASYNEPPEIVENCLESALRLEYPRDRFMVQLVDDSTNAATVSRLEAFCRARGVDFRHRTDRRGFKGGALNDGLRALDRPVDLVAIIDSDYVVDPRFLRLAVQPFRDPEIGFVQTPQAYRNAGRGTFARWYALADAYFYRVIQPVRARAQSLLFCGTMGVLRRTALLAAGGWSEQCVTEDAELSLRMLAAGWKAHYVPVILGWGLAPDLMSAVRSQHRRWAFGGMQLLHMNREKLRSAHLSLRQRVDFRMGGLFWVDGLFLVGVTTALASLVVASWFGVTLPIDSTTALAVIASAPLLLMVDGLIKLRLALRASTPVTYRDALGIIAFWYAIKMNDLRAALRGWWGAKMAFVRTPKEAHPNPGVRGERLRRPGRHPRRDGVPLGGVPGPPDRVRRRVAPRLAGVLRARVRFRPDLRLHLPPPRPASDPRATGSGAPVVGRVLGPDGHVTSRRPAFPRAGPASSPLRPRLSARPPWPSFVAPAHRERGIRPTWYAGPATRLGEFWTMLHLPYTAMVLAFVVVGAAIAPRFSALLLGGTLLAYFLGLGIGAHFLDQVPGMGSRYVTHWSPRELWGVGVVALGAAVAVGVAGAVWFAGPWLLGLVAVQAVCAAGYPLASLFRGALHRDSVFALSWGSLPFLTSFYAQGRSVDLDALILGAGFGAVALLEIRLSRRSRRLRAAAGTGADLRAPESPPAARAYRGADVALEVLSFGTILVSLGVLLGRLGFGS
jgi:cellulose synthase/poly-beta-1,6-N-acetylglucosamine synthase-like glycosyltransferase